MHLFQSLSILALITVGIAHPFIDGFRPSSLSKRLEQDATIGQYYSADCSGKAADDNDFKGPNGNVITLANRLLEAKSQLTKGSCTAWYPYLDQQHGQSVGVDFNTDKYDRIEQVQVFKETDACLAAEALQDGEGPRDICCHEAAGGLLGVINKNGTGGDFGAVKDMGFKGNTCVQLGPGHDQTLWEMRYIIAR